MAKGSVSCGMKSFGIRLFAIWPLEKKSFSITVIDIMDAWHKMVHFVYSKWPLYQMTIRPNIIMLNHLLPRNLKSNDYHSSLPLLHYLLFHRTWINCSMLNVDKRKTFWFLAVMISAAPNSTRDWQNRIITVLKCIIHCITYINIFNHS